MYGSQEQLPIEDEEPADVDMPGVEVIAAAGHLEGRRDRPVAATRFELGRSGDQTLITADAKTAANLSMHRESEEHHQEKGFHAR